MRSMTGYGQARSSHITVEIHSVNRKTLDMNIYLPKELLFLDVEIRRFLSEKLQRGQVTIRIQADLLDQKATLSHLKKLQKKWNDITDALKMPVQVTLPFLLDKMEEEPLKASPELKKELFHVLENALSAFLAMRAKEGAHLAKVLKGYVQEIETLVKKVEVKAPAIKERYRKTLQARLAEFSDERLLKEAMLYAEKSDISEEITRLYSHLAQMKKLLSSKGESVGRSLDFITQEMGRESNTLLAKAGDSEISLLGLEIKSLIEKIREQVQNIE
ncbi:MAG: YicC family protein [Verrucomicrobia bacterium]|nr:YicC family protein [Verrucomicrobiota bacterium]